MDFNVFMNHALFTFGVALVAVIICVGLVFAIGYATQRINIKNGLDKDDSSSTIIGKMSLMLIIGLGVIAFVGTGVVLLSAWVLCDTFVI